MRIQSGVGACLFFIAITTAQAMADQVVTANHDFTDTTDEQVTLREAIANSADGEVITIQAGVNEIKLRGTLEITNSVAIHGPGSNAFTLTNIQSGDILSVSNSGELILIGVALRDADRAVRNNGRFIAADVLFEGNSAGGNGGAIFNSGEAVITRSDFLNNSSSALGGGIAHMSGSLDVIDTTFVDNVASWGGGIFANSGDIAISQVTLKGNANNAIANIAARMEVTNTTITQNTTASLDTGAGLTNQSGEVDLVFTTISDNISENSSFGGIRVTGGRVTLENSIIIGNHGTTTEADCNLFGTGQISSNGGNVFSESGDCPINMDDSSINSSDNAADVIAGAQQIANRHFVHTIAPGSPAINAVKQPSCLSVTLARDFGDDQIGLSRPRFAPLRYCDSGAIEHRPCLGKSVTIFGSQGNDVIHGTPGDDVIHGLGGNDLIFGGGGNDRICGGAGADILLGNEGFDRLRGNSGNDFLYDRTGNFNGGIDQNKCIRLQAGLATALDEC